DGMQLARRLVERLALGEDFFLALIELELVAAFQHVAEHVMAGMAVRRRAAAGRDVERDHHDLAAGDVREHLLEQRGDRRGRGRLLRHDGRRRTHRHAQSQGRKERGGEASHVVSSTFLLRVIVGRRNAEIAAAPDSLARLGRTVRTNAWRGYESAESAYIE